MKPKRIVIYFLFLLGGLQVGYAQSRTDIRIGIQAEGGTPAQQDFFRDNFIMETEAAGYTVEDPLVADYTLRLEIRRNTILNENGTEGSVPPGEKQFILGIRLMKNADSSEIVYFEFAFTELEEMNEYNLYLLYNAMANIAPPQYPVEPPEIEKWLWVGIRGGTSLRLYSREKADPFYQRETYDFWNYNVALEASVHLFRYLDIQVEGIFTVDKAPYTNPNAIEQPNRPFVSNSLMFPLLAKVKLQGRGTFVGFLAGPYFFLPLGQMENREMGDPKLDYKMDLPLGYMLGVNTGVKLGPGYLFLDIRWAADLGKLQRTSDGAEIYKRSMVMFNLGYGMGFFNKKPKQ